MSAKLPMLTGYRVLDITQFVAGPTCTRILAELGAEVIKLELAPYGDRGRASGDKPRDAKFKTCSQSTYFFQHNHSKKSLAVDIKQARGRELVRAIVPKVDVLVENFAPGVMARSGTIRNRNRRPRNRGDGGDVHRLRPAAPRAHRRGAIHRLLARRYVLQHARSERSEIVVARIIVCSEARGLSPSGRRAHWSVPIPRRRVHRDHGDAVSVEPDDQGDEHAGIGR